MPYREGQSPQQELIVSPEVYEADTLDILLYGTDEQISRLEPVELILLLDSLTDWIGVADVTEIEHGVEARNELLMKVDSILAELGDAAQATDKKKITTFVKRTVKELRRFTPLFELAQTGKSEHKEIERTEKNKDLAFEEYFDPTFYGYDTIAAHTERVLLSFEIILAKHEHAEVYEPVLESLRSAMAKIIQEQVVNKNALLYKEGSIMLADIQARMPERHWNTLLQFLHTHRELHTAIKGKEFEDAGLSKGKLIDSRGNVVSSKTGMTDIPLANMLHVALRETVDTLQTDRDQERNVARKLLDDWYGPHKPEQFDVEALTWDIELSEIIDAVEDKELKAMLVRYKRELSVRVRKDTVDPVLVAVESFLDLYTRRKDLFTQEDTLDEYVEGPVGAGVSSYGSWRETPLHEVGRELLQRVADQVVVIARYHADLTDQIAQTKARINADAGDHALTTNERWGRMKAFLTTDIGRIFSFDSAAVIMKMREAKQDKVRREEAELKTRITRLDAVLDVLQEEPTTKETLQPVCWQGDLDLDKEKNIDLRLLRRVSGAITYSGKEPLLLPQLRKCGDIHARLTTVFDAPQLHTSGDIEASDATTFDISQLHTGGRIGAGRVKIFDAPNLHECISITAHSAEVINASKLLDLKGSIGAFSAHTFNIPHNFLDRIANLDG